jgi:tRNA threonylcarbamoyladenosine biosynthesis protein TsaB
VARDGEVLRERAGDSDRPHDMRLPGDLMALLEEVGIALDDVDVFAVATGPGSFTGLRIACGVAQGLAFGTGLPVVPVGTLLALAEAAGAPRVVACLDARMGEIYHAAYQRNDAGWSETVTPNVCKAGAAAALEGGDWVGCGNGFAVYGDALAARYHGQLARVQSQAFPHAREVAQLALPILAAGHGVPAEQAVPLYVRDKVARKMHEQP